MASPRVATNLLRDDVTQNLKALPQTLERVKGIEPSSSAWKAVALPLSYTRKLANSVASTVHAKNGGCRIRTYEGSAIRFTV
jgi:hypothetical protein